VFCYFEDLPGRRLRPDLVDSETALEQAKAFARAERERSGNDQAQAAGASAGRKC
jgi:hypothetical protein